MYICMYMCMYTFYENWIDAGRGRDVSYVECRCIQACTYVHIYIYVYVYVYVCVYIL